MATKLFFKLYYELYLDFYPYVVTAAVIAAAKGYEFTPLPPLGIW